MKVFLYPNLSKNNCAEYTAEACEVLKSCGIEYSVSEKHRDVLGNIEGMIFGHTEECMDSADIIIAIGGDGTILKCAGRASRLKTPILGINCGRLGFMAAIEYDGLYKLSKLMSRSYTVMDRMLLECTHFHGGTSDTYTSLNEVVIASKIGHLSDFEVKIDDLSVSRVRADGVIFSTPTGSTAYAAADIFVSHLDNGGLGAFCVEDLLHLCKCDCSVPVGPGTAVNHKNIHSKNILYQSGLCKRKVLRYSFCSGVIR